MRDRDSASPSSAPSSSSPPFHSALSFLSSFLPPLFPFPIPRPRPPSAQLEELYTLLYENYVEDDDEMFRFNYKREFLRWAMSPPGAYANWLVGVRHKESKALRAFISGIPVNIRVYDRTVRMCEINFLCVHKKLRTKRLAPVLIREITRRVNRCDIWQAVYTAGIVLPKPVSSVRYWHRSLNPKKLIECQFSRLGPRMTLARTIRLYKLPEEPALPGIRAMLPKDVPSVTRILNEYLAKFNLKMVFDEHEVAHWILPKPGVVDSYVVPNPATGDITDLVSYYHLPSSVMKNPKYKDLNAVYSFYNVPGAHSLKDLMNDAMILATKNGADVFNALDLMENDVFLKDLKFGPGDGNLQYYLYNWGCPDVSGRGLGLVLL